MKVDYKIEQRTSAEGVIDLEPDVELAWLQARSEAERRSIIEPLVRQHAMAADDWVYEQNVSFMATPDS